MRLIFTLFFCWLSCLSAFAVEPNATVIGRGRLTSNMDGNAQSITNLGAIIGTNGQSLAGNPSAALTNQPNVFTASSNQFTGKIGLGQADIENFPASGVEINTTNDSYFFSTTNGLYTPGLNNIGLLTNTGAIYGQGGFFGSGSGLTALPAGQLNGTVADARLTANVALLNGQNNFSASNYYGIGLALPSVGDTTPQYKMAFLDNTNGAVVGAIYFLRNTGHGYELNLFSQGGGALVCGNNGQQDSVFHIGASAPGTTRYGDIYYLQYDINPDSGTPLGYSKFFGWVARYWNGSAVKDRFFSFRHNILDQNGNSELAIYPFTHGYNQTFDDPANSQRGAFGTNAFGYLNLVASNNVTAGGQFIGSGAGVTNLNYAVFSYQVANGANGATFSAITWSKVGINTTGLDSATAFSLSSGVLTVQAAGAGRWRVRGLTQFYDDNTALGHVKSRLRRTNNTAATLVVGQMDRDLTYAGSSYLAGVVTLTAGDTIELQGWAASSTPQFGFAQSSGSGEVEVYATLEFERQ